MQKINSAAGLRVAILELESKQSVEAELLKEQFHITYESVKPVSLIKSILKQAVESSDLKDNLVTTSVGLTAGFVSKLLFQGLTRNPLKKLIGTALMFGITNIVAKNPEIVQSLGHRFLKMLRSKSANRTIEATYNGPG